jgi:iron only hydrogenase large subunit-like protein
LFKNIFDIRAIRNDKKNYFTLKNIFILKTTEGTQKMLLTGVCPGFVCYAEKTHGDLLIPLVSRIRSPQAITGHIFKEYFSKKLNTRPEELFVVSVMPCFDKKLEASRKEFATLENQEDEHNREVDCVITPSGYFILLYFYFIPNVIVFFANKQKKLFQQNKKVAK